MAQIESRTSSNIQLKSGVETIKTAMIKMTAIILLSE